MKLCLRQGLRLCYLRSGTCEAHEEESLTRWIVSVGCVCVVTCAERCRQPWWLQFLINFPMQGPSRALVTLVDHTK